MSTHNIGFYEAEVILMSTHNIGFYEEISKIIINMVTLQSQSDQRLKTVMDLKSSLTKANDKNDFYLSPGVRNRSSVSDKTQYSYKVGGGGGGGGGGGD